MTSLTATSDGRSGTRLTSTGAIRPTGSANTCGGPVSTEGADKAGKIGAPAPQLEVHDEAYRTDPTRPSCIRVYLVDDHPVVAMGMRIGFASDQRLRLVGHSATLEEGLLEAALGGIDILVLDLAFSGSIRLDAVQMARKMLSRTIIVIFSALPASIYAAATLKHGANAYVGKEFDIAHLGSIIVRTNADGRASLSKITAQAALKSLLIDGVHLTAREAQVASHLGRGLDVVEIAAELAVSRRTISVHRDSIRRKLGCINSRALIAKLVRLDAASI